MTLKRAELVERLKQLAESEPPKDLEPGACCYMTAGDGCGCFFISLPIEIIVTMLDLDYRLGIHRAYRIPLNRLRDLGLNAKLICSDRKFQLEIRYPDRFDPVMAKLKEPFDLELMELFLQKKDRYKSNPHNPGSGEIALQEKVDRLAELFGIGIEEIGIDIEEVFYGLAKRKLTKDELKEFFENNG